MAKCQIRLPCVKGGGIFAENDGGIVEFGQWRKVNTHAPPACHSLSQGRISQEDGGGVLSDASLPTHTNWSYRQSEISCHGRFFISDHISICSIVIFTLSEILTVPTPKIEV